MGSKKGWALAPLALVAFFGEALAEPKLLRAVPPDYPRAAERRDIEGHVQIKFDVTSEGKTANVGVIEATPAGVFDSSAISAVERWKFESGVPAEGITKKIVFQLED